MKKFSLKDLSLSLVTVLTFVHPMLSAQADEIGRFPVDWFVMPEDQGHFYDNNSAVETEERDGVIFRRNLEAVDQSLDRTFVAAAEALSSTGKVGVPYRRPENAPPDWVPWHLKEMYMSLGVNVAGTAGLVTAIGDASCEVRWARPGQYQNLEGNAAPVTAGSAKADLSIDSNTSPEELAAKIDGITELVMATGKVQNRGFVREGLLQTANDLQALMVDVNKYNGASWEVGRFEIDVDISASGVMGPGTTVGGAVRLRFEWKRTELEVIEETPRADGGVEERRENLRKLVGEIARDISTIPTDAYRDTGFSLSQFKIGIGVYASTDIAIVRGNIGVTGFAFFTPTRDNQSANRGRPVPMAESHISVLDPETEASHINYADRHGVSHLDASEGAQRGRTVFMVPREKFQKGMERAVQLGAFFAKRAAQSTNAQSSYPRWQIDQLQPQFSLSLQGIMSVFTIGGKASLELTFNRRI